MPTDKEEELHGAARNGQVEEVRALLSEGVDKDCMGGYFETTPLSEAAMSDHVHVAKLLIDAGADINKGDIYGRTPLHIAVWEGHENIVKLLIEARADINEEDGQSP